MRRSRKPVWAYPSIGGSNPPLSVNVWDVNQHVQALIRSARPVDASALRDSGTDLRVARGRARRVICVAPPVNREDFLALAAYVTVAIAITT